MIQDQITKLKAELEVIQSENIEHNKASFGLKILIKGNEKRLKLISEQIKDLEDYANTEQETSREA